MPRRYILILYSMFGGCGGGGFDQGEGTISLPESIQASRMTGPWFSMLGDGVGVQDIILPPIGY